MTQNRKQIGVLIYNREQLIDELREFYAVLLSEGAGEVIDYGHKVWPMPSIVMKKGLIALTEKELMVAADDWANMIIDSSFDNDGADRISLILFRNKDHVDEILMSSTSEISIETSQLPLTKESGL